MKFFWKIFFATMFISIGCFSLGGYILIRSNFSALLENEVQTAYEYGDIVYYSLANELYDANISYYHWEREEDIRETVSRVAQSTGISNMNQRITFGITDADGEEVFTSLAKSFDKGILSSLKDNQAGWSLKKDGNSIYIQSIRPAVFRDDTFYIEMLRDVTSIFDNQKVQYETLLKVMAGMLLLGGLITFTVSKLLMKRVVSLTKTTKEISAGNLSKRVNMSGGDEFAVLSQNFNKMADSLEEKIYELKDSAEKKELFVGAFSHELKTPLTSVIGYADMLRRKKMSGEQVHTCAEYIFAEGKRLEILSMRLLNLIVLKKQELHTVPVEVEDLFKEICFMIMPQLTKAGIHFSCGMETAVIEMDRELMKTVFVNLIDNARKAMEDGGEIRVDGVWRGGKYVVTIQDAGKGMEKQELDRIKEAFYMVDKSRSRKQGGAGLGLALCDEILKLHGFDITFESAVNIGTSVTITMKEGADE